VRVFVMESAMREVWDTVDLTNGMVERGGALAGCYCTDPETGQRFVVITDALAAQSAPASRVHIEIRPREWRDIFCRLEGLTGRRLLGWYHSHPGLGIDMSVTDRETQRLVFHAEWQVGLVVDPGSRRFCFYQGAAARRARWLAMAVSAPSEA
jgi:hypothetical protein